MIKANELRIGNHVLYKPYGNRDGQPVRIEGLLGMKAYFDRHSNESGMLHCLQPIPLSEEWLDRMGFEKRDIDGQIYFSFGGVDIAASNSSDGYFLVTEDAHEGNLYWLGNPFKHVHQLQNLYFALTGEELSINEKHA